MTLQTLSTLLSPQNTEAEVRHRIASTWGEYQGVVDPTCSRLAAAAASSGAVSEGEPAALLTGGPWRAG